MAMHGSTLRDPSGVATVRRLLEILSDFDADSPVYFAIGENDSGIDMAPLLSISEIREPLSENRVVLMVPKGALGDWYERSMAAQATGEPDASGRVEEEPS